MPAKKTRPQGVCIICGHPIKGSYGERCLCDCGYHEGKCERKHDEHCPEEGKDNGK